MRQKTFQDTKLTQLLRGGEGGRKSVIRTEFENTEVLPSKSKSVSEYYVLSRHCVL